MSCGNATARGGAALLRIPGQPGSPDLRTYIRPSITDEIRSMGKRRRASRFFPGHRGQRVEVAQQNPLLGVHQPLYRFQQLVGSPPPLWRRPMKPRSRPRTQVARTSSHHQHIAKRSVDHFRSHAAEVLVGGCAQAMVARDHTIRAYFRGSDQDRPRRQRVDRRCANRCNPPSAWVCSDSGIRRKGSPQRPPHPALPDAASSEYSR